MVGYILRVRVSPFLRNRSRGGQSGPGQRFFSDGSNTHRKLFRPYLLLGHFRMAFRKTLELKQVNAYVLVFMALTALSNGLGQLFTNLALANEDVVVVLSIQSTYPLVTALIVSLVGREKFSPKTLLGAFFVVLGCLLVVIR